MNNFNLFVGKINTPGTKQEKKIIGCDSDEPKVRTSPLHTGPYAQMMKNNCLPVIMTT